MAGNQTTMKTSSSSPIQQDLQGLSVQQHHLANASGHNPGPCHINLSAESPNTTAGQGSISCQAWNQESTVDDMLAMLSSKNNSGSMSAHMDSRSDR